MVRVLLVLTIFKALGFGSAVRIGENETLTRAAVGCKDAIKGEIQGRQVLCCKLFQGKCDFNRQLNNYNIHDVDNSLCGQGIEGSCGAMSVWQGCTTPGACDTEIRKKKARDAETAREVAKIKAKEEAARKAAEEKAAKELGIKRAKEEAEAEKQRKAAEKHKFLKDNCKPHSNIECSSWTAKNAMSKYGTENDGCPHEDHVFCNTKAEIEGKYVCSCSDETECFDEEAPDGNSCLVHDLFYGKYGPQ